MGNAAAFPEPLEVLKLRTSAKEWNHADKYGRCGELFLFWMKKESFDPHVKRTV